MSFLSEIRRRKVFQVAAVYAVVSWLIIQIVAVVSEPLNLPDWFDTTVIVLLAIGFPIVLILGWVFDLTPAGERSDGATPRGDSPGPSSPVFTYVVQGLVLIAVGFLVFDQFVLESDGPPLTADVAAQPEVRSVVRFSLPIGEDSEVFLGGRGDTEFGRPVSNSVALSDDGNLLVYAGWQIGAEGRKDSQLYLRRLDREGVGPIVGSEGGSAPFFARDDAAVGFFVGRTLKRVSLIDNRIETVVADTDVLDTGVRGASWAHDDTIVFGGIGGVYRVPANGGTPKLIAEVGGDARAILAQPTVLPGGRYLLFHSITETQDPSLAAVHVRDLVSGDERTLLTNAMDPRYVAKTGHLLFMRQGSLLAVGFDAVRAELLGAPVVVLEDVMQAVGMPNGNSETGAAQLALSSFGHIAYASGGVYPDRTLQVMRIALDGTLEPILSEALSFNRVRMSPNGEQLAIEAVHGRGLTLHVHDLVRGVTQQLNGGRFLSARPIWSPDGSTILFETDIEDGVRNIYRIAADSSGVLERVVPSPQAQTPASWSSTGAIAYLERASSIARGDRDIWVQPPNGPAVPFVATAADEVQADFSPDGGWLAYVSNETGREQVYVRAYPGPGPAIQVSSDGGTSPSWSLDGSALYFVVSTDASGRDTMMIVDIESTEPFRTGRARLLIDPWPASPNTPTRDYDVLRDGGFIAPVTEDFVNGFEFTENIRRRRYAVERLHMVLNFTEELRQRVRN